MLCVLRFIDIRAVKGRFGWPTCVVMRLDGLGFPGSGSRWDEGGRWMEGCGCGCGSGWLLIDLGVLAHPEQLFLAD